jgi:predicted lipoprotein with Yx(FWY)xxD motif
VKEPEAPTNKAMSAVRGRSVVLAVAVLALVMTSCASKKPAASGGGGGAGGSIATTSVSGVGTVLVNAQGRTLYYLMTDNHSQPTCTGSCASTWPPMIVSGSVPAAGSGVTGTLGTVANPDGGKQLTYMGWPLYIYSGDSAAGQANGQGSGGVWFAMAASGPTGSGGGSSPSSGGKYGGY